MLPKQIIYESRFVRLCVEERQQVVVYLYSNELDRCASALLRSLDVSSIFFHICLF